MTGIRRRDIRAAAYTGPTLLELRGKLEAVERLTRELRELEVSEAHARVCWHAALLDAYDAGIRPVKLAAAAGISTQRLSVLLKREQARGASTAGGSHG